MFKRKNNKKRIVAMAGAMAMVGVMSAQSATVFAANPIESGETPVIYDNRQVLPDGNGQYGMIIPTAIAFTDDSTTGNADVSITGINGYELSDWKTLTVKASVASQNDYQLQLVGDSSKYATYDLTYGTDNFASAGTHDITEKLGIDGAGTNKETVKGIATLKDKTNATKKGQYKDTLTYTFNEEANELR